MGLALVEMLRCMADEGILEMRDDCEFRSVGLRVSWLGVAVAAEVASLVGGAAAAAVCRRCIAALADRVRRGVRLHRAGQDDAGRAGRRGAWQATEPIAPATPCPLRSGRDPAAPGRLPASCLQSAPRGAPPPAQPPSLPLTDATIGAPPDTTGSLGKMPGGPGGNRADILPGRYRDERSADRPASKVRKPETHHNGLIGALDRRNPATSPRARNRSVRSRSATSVALRDDRWPRPSREIRRSARHAADAG